MPAIEWNTPFEQYNQKATQMGCDLSRHAREGRFDKVAAGYIFSKAYKVIVRLMDYTNDDYNNIINDMETLAMWINSRSLHEAIALMTARTVDVNLDVVLNPAYFNKPIDKWNADIYQDLCIAFAWIVYKGADGVSKRRNLSAKMTKTISNIIRDNGNEIPLSMLYRSMCASVKMIDKVLIPRYLELKKGSNDVRINTMASAFRGLK